MLYLPLPSLPTTSQKSDSILIGENNSTHLENNDDILIVGGKWEDEEERRFFEDVQDLKDFVPSSVLGIDEASEKDDEDGRGREKERLEKEKEEVRKLEQELEKLERDGATNGEQTNGGPEPELNEEE